VTTDVASDRAEPEPSALDAVTRTRIRAPTSAVVSTYVVLVAPEIGTQLAPAVSHRCHPNMKLIGVVPVQLPVPATSVWSFAAEPVIVGSDVLAGAA